MDLGGLALRLSFADPRRAIRAPPLSVPRCRMRRRASSASLSLGVPVCLSLLLCCVADSRRIAGCPSWSTLSRTNGCANSPSGIAHRHRQRRHAPLPRRTAPDLQTLARTLAGRGPLCRARRRAGDGGGKRALQHRLVCGTARIRAGGEHGARRADLGDQPSVPRVARGQCAAERIRGARRTDRHLQPPLLRRALPRRARPRPRCGAARAVDPDGGHRSFQAL